MVAGTKLTKKVHKVHKGFLSVESELKFPKQQSKVRRNQESTLETVTEWAEEYTNWCDSDQ